MKQKWNKSYFKLAKMHHPDLQGGDEQMFKKISNAYDVLKDKKTRAEYDELREEILTGIWIALFINSNEFELIKFSKFFNIMA